MDADLKSYTGFVTEEGIRYGICRTYLFDTHKSTDYHFQTEWLEKFKIAPGLILKYDDNKSRYIFSYLDNAEIKRFIDYYPKANKILIRHQNEWINPGLRWLIREFLNE